MWNLIEKSFSQSLMKPIGPLEHYDLIIISWLRRPRSLGKLIPSFEKTKKFEAKLFQVRA